MDAELLQELRTELNRLNGQVEAMREAGYDRNEIEQHTNTFEGEWLERLTIEQRAETRGAKTGVEAAFEERDRQANTRDAQRLEGMTPEGQVAYWNSNRTGNGVSQEQQRAQETNRAVEQTTKQISTDYNDLRYATVKAIAQIEVGQWRGGLRQQENDGPTPPGPGPVPPPSVLVAQQLDKENTPAPAKEQVTEAQQDGTAPARPNVDLSQETWKQYQARTAQEEQAPQRQAQELAQEQERQRALER